MFGKFYRAVDMSDASPSFTEVTGSPYGLKPGTVLNLAQSVFIQDMNSADIQNYTQIDDAGTVDNPPNVRSLIVAGMVAGNRYSVYRTTGTGLTTIRTTEFDVGTIGGGNNQAGDSTILVGAQDRGVSPLPDDIPASGFLSVEKTGIPGEYWLFEYSSRDKTNNTFTLATTASQPTGTIGDITGTDDLTLDNNVFVHLSTGIAIGATASVNITYVADIPFVLEFRLKGLRPFQVTGDFIGTANTTVTAVRNNDPVVDF